MRFGLYYIRIYMRRVYNIVYYNQCECPQQKKTFIRTRNTTKPFRSNKASTNTRHHNKTQHAMMSARLPLLLKYMALVNARVRQTFANFHSTRCAAADQTNTTHVFMLSQFCMTCDERSRRGARGSGTGVSMVILRALARVH